MAIARGLRLSGSRDLLFPQDFTLGSDEVEDFLLEGPLSQR